ncbi:MAG: chemotaxis protein CheB, partial [Pyrinomonadaceae bacterium]
MKATKNKSSRSPRARFDATKAHEVEIPQDAHESSLPVVGIGASAGGLEAFTQLLAHLPLDTGMAFVLVQHLDSTHESLLTELLSRTTEMPVNEVSDGMAVEPNHIYVIPRNTNMAIAGGVLHLRPRQKARGQHRPIDYFLRSLAEDQTTSAIGDALKQGEAQIKESRDYAEAIVGTVSRSLVILDEDLRVQMASRYFYDTFKVTRVNTETRLIYELGNHQWDIPALRELLEDILLRHGQFQGFEIEREFEHIGHRTMLLSAREIVQDTSRRRLILLDIEDITERKRAEEEIRQSAERLRFMAESMPQKIFTAKPDGNVDYFNQQWMEFTGLSFEQIKDWGWAQFIHSD